MPRFIKFHIDRLALCASPVLGTKIQQNPRFVFVLNQIQPILFFLGLALHVLAQGIDNPHTAIALSPCFGITLFDNLYLLFICDFHHRWGLMKKFPSHRFAFFRRAVPPVIRVHGVCIHHKTTPCQRCRLGVRKPTTTREKSVNDVYVLDLLRLIHPYPGNV